MTFPRAPAADIDWNHLEFKIREVNGHVESQYDVKTGEWSEPKFVRDPELKIHGLAPALNYGQQAYEGLKAYRDPNGNINIFRPRKHASRMVHSASYVSIPAFPPELFLRCVQLVVSLNTEFVPPHGSSSLLYIRPLIFGLSPHLGLTRPQQFKFCVYVQPIPNYHGSDPVDAVIMEEFDRAAPNGTGSAKIGGNYAPVIRWSDKAREQKFGITLHLDSKTASDIEEFSTSGFLGIKQRGEEYTVVVPDSNNIIQSVTSDSCLTLARSFGWKVERRRIPYSELPEFTEVLAVGTAASVVPIASISKLSTGEKTTYLRNSDQPGYIFAKILNALRDIQQGKKEDQFDWLQKVENTASPVLK